MMLEGLKDNFEKLIALYETERGRNEELSARLEEASARCESYQKQIFELESKIDRLKLTEAFIAPGGNTAGAKEKIDKLIKEIDKCISLLEN